MSTDGPFYPSTRMGSGPARYVYMSPAGSGDFSLSRKEKRHIRTFWASFSIYQTLGPRRLSLSCGHCAGKRASDAILRFHLPFRVGHRAINRILIQNLRHRFCETVNHSNPVRWDTHLPGRWLDNPCLLIYAESGYVGLGPRSTTAGENYWKIRQ